MEYACSSSPPPPPPPSRRRGGSRRHRRPLAAVPNFLILLVCIVVVAAGGGSSSSFPVAAKLEEGNASETPVSYQQHPGASPPEDGKNGNGNSKANDTGSDDPLEQWLHSLKLQLPDQSFKSGLITLKISNLVCTEFEIDGVESSSSSSSSSSSGEDDTEKPRGVQPFLALSVHTISANCTAKYEASHLWVSGNLRAVVGVVPAADGGILADEEGDGGPAAALAGSVEDWEEVDAGGGYLTGRRAAVPATHAAAEDGDVDALRWKLCLQGGSYAPSSAKTASCDTNLAVVDLDFEGSVSAKIVDLFKGSVAKYVSTAINSQVCPTLSQQVDPMITSFIHKMREYLKPYLHNLTVATPHPSKSDPAAAADEDLGGGSRINATRSSGRPANSKGEQLDGNRNIVAPTAAAATVSRRTAKMLRPGSNMLYDADANRTSDDDSDIVDLFREAPALVSLLRNFNRNFLSQYLHRGFLRRAFPDVRTDFKDEDCGALFDGVNGVIKSFLLPDGGKLPIPLNQSLLARPFVVIALPDGAGSLELSAESLTLEGIDRWKRLQVLEPESNLYWASRITTQATKVDPNVSSASPTTIAATARITFNLTLFQPKSVARGGDTNDRSPSVQPTTIVRTLDMYAGASELDAWLDVDVGLRRSLFNEVTVGQVVTAVQDLVLHGNATFLDCVLEAVHRLVAGRLGADIRIGALSVKPTNNTAAFGSYNNSYSLERDLERLANTILKLIVTNYGRFIGDAILGLSTSDDLRNVVNGFINSTLAQQREGCPTAIRDTTVDTSEQHAAEVLVQPSRHYANFSKWLILHQLQDLLSDQFTLASLNSYVGCASRFLGRGMRQTATASVIRPLIGEVEGLDVSVREFEIKNAGSLRHIQVMSPQADGMSLSSGIDFLASNSSAKLATIAAGTAALTQAPGGSLPQLATSLDVHYEPLNLSASINVTVVVDRLSLLSGSILHFDIDKLFSLHLSKLLSRAECALTPVQQPSWMIDLQGDLGFFETIFNASIVHSRNSQNAGPISVNFDSDQYPKIEKIADAAWYWTVNSTRDLLRAVSGAALTKASQKCSSGGGPKRGEDDTDKDNSEFTSILVVMSAVFLLMQPTMLLIQQHRSTASTALNEPRHFTDDRNELDEPLLPPAAVNDSVLFNEPLIHGDNQNAASTSDSLMESQYVPELARTGLPVVIFLTVALFLASNLSIGATVDLKVLTGGGEASTNSTTTGGQQPLFSLSLFNFSLMHTAMEMWNAGIYPLFFLVVVFSGIWPYVKLFMMLFGWVTRTKDMDGDRASTPAPASPPSAAASRRITTERRGRLLLALDALGKLSLVDAFVLVLFVVAFSYHLTISEDTTLNVFVTPAFGFYAFLVATSSSLVASHALVYYHRRDQLQLHHRIGAEDEDEGSFEDPFEPEPLCEHVFTVSENGVGGGTTRRLQLSRLFQCTLLILLVTTTILLGIGIKQSSFVFEFGGLAGMLLDDDVRNATYSLLTLGSKLSQSVEKPSFGIYALQLAYYFYSVVTPLGCILFLICLLFVPFSLERQMLVLTLAEISNAWSAIEVFCLSIIAAVMQISSFADFIIGHRCDLLNEILEDYFQDENDDNASCFSVHSSVLGNVFYLVAGVLLNSFLVSMVLRIAHVAVNERIQITMMERKRGQEERRVVLDPLQRQQHLAECSSNIKDGSVEEGTIIQWLASRRASSSQWTSWILVPEGDGMELQPRSASAVAPSTPPRHQCKNDVGEEMGSPWQSRDAFQEEWSEAAERDPSWREWKNATNVT